jgi:hypothetical protein
MLRVKDVLAFLKDADPEMQVVTEHPDDDRLCTLLGVSLDFDDATDKIVLVLLT